jgi:hypothetical protein
VREVIALLLAFTSTSALAASFEGLWLQCLQSAGRDPIIAVTVSRSSGTYTWSAEWLVPWSAEGTARLAANGDLPLRGCKSYRGELEKTCNSADPPVVFVLPRSALQRRRATAESVLRAGGWWRTTEASWQQDAKYCEAPEE